MSYKLLYGAAIISAITPSCSPESARKAQSADRPNLLFIMTDEQTTRSIGCYREYMDARQAYSWGPEAVVETPHLDKLASEGAMCLNFHSSSPVSTPSRASFQTGLYPVTAMSPINGMAMDPSRKTFATILNEEGYQTILVGKWHLAGTPSLGRKLYMAPGFDFGWKERTYAFETKHQKWYEIVGEPNKILVNNRRDNTDPDMYSTDFLTNRAIEAIDRAKQKDNPFCLFLSIPDPHSPEISREPYTSMYKNMKVEAPVTCTEEAIANRPIWATQGKGEARTKFNPRNVREYFGMVKCVDDNIGKIVSYLKENNLYDNTIIVFTSDHGEMMYHHNRMDKGLPYDDSARVPFLISYPGKIEAGKKIYSSYTCCDFAPTILSILGAEGKLEGIDGIDDSKNFLSKQMEVRSDRIVYITDSPFNDWVAATDGRYKLVISTRDTPWLYDREIDPLETVNEYDNPKYKDIAQKLQTSLIAQMKQYNEPGLGLERPFLYSSDATNNYEYIYEGQTFRQIVDSEKEVLPAAIFNLHDKVYRKF